MCSIDKVNSDCKAILSHEFGAKMYSQSLSSFYSLFTKAYWQYFTITAWSQKK